uniref:Uncharacterized protein n=1 Tax=Rhizophora mucronata TaxID=61149 RepID=A0A2P2QZ97_RHIMU
MAVNLWNGNSFHLIGRSPSNISSKDRIWSM